METKQERRNRLYRERYAKNEAMRNRYQVKARAAIPERNEKRKEKTLKKRKESWKIAFGRKVYDINALILESYEHEKTMLMKLEKNCSGNLKKVKVLIKATWGVDIGIQ